MFLCRSLAHKPKPHCSTAAPCAPSLTPWKKYSEGKSTPDSGDGDFLPFGKAEGRPAARVTDARQKKAMLAARTRRERAGSMAPSRGNFSAKRPTGEICSTRAALTSISDDAGPHKK